MTNVREQRWINVREKRWFNVVNQRWFNVVNQRWEKRFKSQRYPNVGNQRYLTLKQRSRAHWVKSGNFFVSNIRLSIMEEQYHNYGIFYYFVSS